MYRPGVNYNNSHSTYCTHAIPNSPPAIPASHGGGVATTKDKECEPISLSEILCRVRYDAPHPPLQNRKPEEAPSVSILGVSLTHSETKDW